jgi:hypothetical protein
MPDRRRKFPGVAVGVLAPLALVLAVDCTAHDKPVDVRTAGVSDTASPNGTGMETPPENS